MPSTHVESEPIIGMIRLCSIPQPVNISTERFGTTKRRFGKYEAKRGIDSGQMWSSCQCVQSTKSGSGCSSGSNGNSPSNFPHRSPANKSRHHGSIRTSGPPLKRTIHDACVSHQAAMGASIGDSISIFNSSPRHTGWVRCSGTTQSAIMLRTRERPSGSPSRGRTRLRRSLKMTT